ncbi:MAG: hypothetical protein J0647_00725 [Campylobacteraceae bacterium]|nr:hypothetical protein [Campylobacteraceae bacterium]
MKLDQLEARKIIKMVLGDKRETRDEDELAQLLKKRLTKKEREVLNAKASGVDKEETMSTLKIDEARYEVILAGAIKKLKNESVHGDFFNKVSRINQDV